MQENREIERRPHEEAYFLTEACTPIFSRAIDFLFIFVILTAHALVLW